MKCVNRFAARSPVLSHLTTTLEGLPSIRTHNLQQLMIHEFNLCQDQHTETWFLFIATSRWFAYRLDFLCTLFVFMASFTPLFIAERRGKGNNNQGLGISLSLQLITLTSPLDYSGYHKNLIQ